MEEVAVGYNRKSLHTSILETKFRNVSMRSVKYMFHRLQYHQFKSGFQKVSGSLL